MKKQRKGLSILDAVVYECSPIQPEEVKFTGHIEDVLDKFKQWAKENEQFVHETGDDGIMRFNRNNKNILGTPEFMNLRFIEITEGLRSSHEKVAKSSSIIEIKSIRSAIQSHETWIRMVFDDNEEMRDKILIQRSALLTFCDYQIDYLETVEKNILVDELSMAANKLFCSEKAVDKYIKIEEQLTKRGYLTFEGWKGSTTELQVLIKKLKHNRYFRTALLDDSYRPLYEFIEQRFKIEIGHNFENARLLRVNELNYLKDININPI